MELSPAAQDVLKRYRATLETKLSDTFDFPLKEIKEVYASEREYDAQGHAEWAAERLVVALKNADRNVEYELRNADLWAYKVLRKGYLVQEQWLKHAYEKALELAVKAGRDRRSRCS